MNVGACSPVGSACAMTFVEVSVIRPHCWRILRAEKGLSACRSGFMGYTEPSPPSSLKNTALPPSPSPPPAPKRVKSGLVRKVGLAPRRPETLGLTEAVGLMYGPSPLRVLRIECSGVAMRSVKNSGRFRGLKPEGRKPQPARAARFLGLASQLSKRSSGEPGPAPRRTGVPSRGGERGDAQAEATCFKPAAGGGMPAASRKRPGLRGLCAGSSIASAAPLPMDHAVLRGVRISSPHVSRLAPHNDLPLSGRV
mmetsp:Transcript_7520/g.21480  ORF Transcript_7520/g.21480 Transcript_7520/m.21480 type:complete len:253 (+) Transcript_7520:802-1560(+)